MKQQNIPRDIPGDIVVGGLILAVVTGIASGIPGLGWLLWFAVIGILPFCLVATLAFLDAVLRLFSR